MIRTIYDYYTHEFKEESGIVAAYFQTKTDTGYRVYFYPAKNFFDYIEEGSLIYKNGYNFGFTKIEPNEDKKEPFDARVMNTIINIVNEFYESEGIDSILIFHCDDGWGEDKKEKRFRRFDFWFKHALTKHTFEKYNEEIVINELNSEDGVITDKEYMSLIIERSNQNINSVLDEFQNIKNRFASGK